MSHGLDLDPRLDPLARLKNTATSYMKVILIATVILVQTIYIGYVHPISAEAEANHRPSLSIRKIK